MTESSHAPIVDGLAAARAAEADGRYDDAVLHIHDLHIKYGTQAVLAVVAALSVGPEVRS